ncbi:hypothetical protein GGR53DRAFT_227637 [Hypoxylon sp. FL1150]|nr:hypothetical protein GGR53DRAFT_227637 [Hypoxylon sp. FL1150]
MLRISGYPPPSLAPFKSFGLGFFSSSLCCWLLVTGRLGQDWARLGFLALVAAATISPLTPENFLIPIIFFAHFCIYRPLRSSSSHSAERIIPIPSIPFFFLGLLFSLWTATTIKKLLRLTNPFPHSLDLSVV